MTFRKILTALLFTLTLVACGNDTMCSGVDKLYEMTGTSKARGAGTCLADMNKKVRGKRIAVIRVSGKALKPIKITAKASKPVQPTGALIVKLKPTVMAKLTFYTSRKAETDAYPCVASRNVDICKRHARGETICAIADRAIPLDTVVEGIPELGSCKGLDRMNKRFDPAHGYEGPLKIDVYFGKDLKKGRAWLKRHCADKKCSYALVPVKLTS